MTSVDVASLLPLLLQQQQARVEALETQRHYSVYRPPSSTTSAVVAGEEVKQQVAVVLVVDEPMRRARMAVEAAGLYSSIWTWVPPDYYTSSWSLQARADFLNVPNGQVDYLCKSLLLENKKVVAAPANNDRMMDRTNPKYILVVLQYAATLDVKKLITAIRAMRKNVHDRLDEHADFDVRVASSEDNARLTGYEHNSVTPFGMLQPDQILVVLSKHVLPLRRFWMGGGHVNLKLSVTVSDFVHKSGLNPLIADISNPRTTTGLDLKESNNKKLTTTVESIGGGVLRHTTDGTGSGTANGGAGGAGRSSASSSGGIGGTTPAGGGGGGSATTLSPLTMNEEQHQQLDAKIQAAAALAAAETPEATIIKEKKHKKKHRSSSKTDKNGNSPSSSCASQTSEESKEKKVGAGYIVNVQVDNTDDQSAITTPAMKVKKHRNKKIDKDDKKKKKKSSHRNSKTILEGVEESTTTSSSPRSRKSKEDRSASQPSSGSAAGSSPTSSRSTKSPPPQLPTSAAASAHPPLVVPALPNNSDNNNNNNHEDDEDSPGKMHRFQLLVDGAAPILPVVADVLAQAPSPQKKPKSLSRVIPSRAMSSDLQAIMQRRREMAETLSLENTPTASLLDTTSTTRAFKSKSGTDSRGGGGGDALIHNKSKTGGMSSDLQAIMARRRRLAGDADE
jgi:prolyl-tRNA editing enzyme YbaK/EbsC (Cys-tRNA(Pro) deacylase)